MITLQVGMTRLYTPLALFLISLLGTTAYAAIPAVNRYRIEKRPVASEPTRYTIAATDKTTVTKPPFFYFTHLNLAKPKAVYIIPPYPNTDQLPKVGNWMLATVKNQSPPKYVPAHWLNDLSASGQYIIEPINYLFVVYRHSKRQAIKHIKRAFIRAGLTVRWSGEKYHSGNYHAYLGKRLLTQIKRRDGIFITFSDEHWLHQNDHFRLMGPYKMKVDHKTAFIFLASVSEESNWNQPLYAGHFFVSFGHARSNLATRLIQRGHATYYVLSNNILQTKHETTEDHDGKIFVTVFK